MHKRYGLRFPVRPNRPPAASQDEPRLLTETIIPRSRKSVRPLGRGAAVGRLTSERNVVAYPCRHSRKGASASRRPSWGGRRHCSRKCRRSQLDFTWPQSWWSTTVPRSRSGATRRNETDGQFGKIVVTL